VIEGAGGEVVAWWSDGNWRGGSPREGGRID
jgi:hypothetical protein